MSIFDTLKQKDKRDTKSEEVFPLPAHHTVLGSDSNMVCTIKRCNDNTVKYVCTSDQNQELRFLVLHILDISIDQIHILCGGHSGNSNLAFFDDILKNKSKDSSSLIYDPIYDKNTGEPFKVAFKRRQINKLYTDGVKLKDFLAAIKNELKEFNSFELFRNVLYNVKTKMREAKILFKQTDENHNKMKELKLSLVTQGRDSRLQIHTVNKVYAATCDTVQELLFKNIIQLRYAKEYENSRCEQNKIRNERALRTLQNIISKYRHQIEKENRAHNEILRYINDNQKDLKESIKIWIDKYNMGMELNHFLILQIKDRLEELQKYGAELKILFAEHKKSIKDFKEYKEQKQKKEAEEQKLGDAATKIQAWWRGTMYRRKLGPYNPNKSKKGKNKKKKKTK